MTKKIEVVGVAPKKIEIADEPRWRIEPADLASALGANPAVSLRQVCRTDPGGVPARNGRALSGAGQTACRRDVVRGAVLRPTGRACTVTEVV